MYPSVRSIWMEFNQPLEGQAAFMYLDVQGLIRTAVGALIEDTSADPATLADPATSVDQDAVAYRMVREAHWLNGSGDAASIAEIDAEWNAVRNRPELAARGAGAFRPPVTTLHLSVAEIERFTFLRLDQVQARLLERAECVQYESWPADAQLALLSLAWALGPDFRLPELEPFLAAGDFTAAAAVCRFNPDIGTNILRSDRNEQLFRNAAAARASGQALDTLIYPQAAPPPPSAQRPEPLATPSTEPSLSCSATTNNDD